MKYAYNILISIDQLFNAIAGGNSDVTISGHVGAMVLDGNAKWLFIRNMIDRTFEPLESNHCEDSFLNDNDVDSTNNLFTTSLVAIIGCALLFIPIRIISIILKGK